MAHTANCRFTFKKYINCWRRDVWIRPASATTFFENHEESRHWERLDGQNSVGCLHGLSTQCYRKATKTGLLEGFRQNMTFSFRCDGTNLWLPWYRIVTRLHTKNQCLGGKNDAESIGNLHRQLFTRHCEPSEYRICTSSKRAAVHHLGGDPTA